MHTIAVVEDDRMLNEALARMLQKNGYQVTRAHTLAEGRKLAAGGPDLMIVDIGLPDGEGRYQELTVDFDRKQVFCGEEPVRLTAREYALLELLVKNQGRVVTRKLILQQIWDAEGSFVEENTVNVTLNRLRKKIEPDPSSPVYIRNVFGMGYTFGK